MQRQLGESRYNCFSRLGEVHVVWHEVHPLPRLCLHRKASRIRWRGRVPPGCSARPSMDGGSHHLRAEVFCGQLSLEALLFEGGPPHVQGGGQDGETRVMVVTFKMRHFIPVESEEAKKAPREPSLSSSPGRAPGSRLGPGARSLGALGRPVPLSSSAGSPEPGSPRPGSRAPGSRAPGL